MTTMADAVVAGPLNGYEELLSRLDVAGGRFRLASAARGVARFLMVVVPLSVGAVFAAGWWTLPSWTTVGLVMVVLVSIVAAYAGFLHSVLFRRPTYAEIARLVEEHGRERLPEGQKSLDNALINAVLLAQDFEAAEGNAAAGGGEVKGSSAWIPHVVREAAASTAESPLERAVPWRGPRNAWFWAAGLIAICAAWIMLAPATFAHGMAVLMTPTHFVPHQGAVRIISVVPGNDTAILGQMLAFSVDVDVPAHRAVDARLQIHFASGKTQTLAMTPMGSDNSQYVRQGVLAAEDMDYLITAGDSQSERYHITVLPQIHMAKFIADVMPPPYTAKEKSHVDLMGDAAAKGGVRSGTVEAPMGSMVALSVALDGPAKEVVMDIAGGDPRVMDVQVDGKTFAASLRLKDSLRYTIRVNDGANRTLAQFPGSATDAGQGYFELTAIPDAPPTVAVNEPGRDIDAKPGAKIPLEALATDDYGLQQVRLEIAKNDEKDFRQAQAWAVGVGKDGKPMQSVTVRHMLELPASDYKMGDTLRYRFVAVDGRDLTALDPSLGPQSTQGQIFTISFNDTAAEAAKAGKAWEELRQKLQAILDKQIALRKQAGALGATLAVDDIRKLDTPIKEGQEGVRGDIAGLAKDFPFEPSMKLVQKSLQVLTVEDATSAVDRAADILLLPDAKTLPPLATKLRQHQSRIIDVLQTLLAIAAANEDRLTQTADHEGGDLPPDARDAWKKLADELKDFEKEQKAVIDSTADLAKKPKDQFGPNDDKKLQDLKLMEDKWENFLSERLADMSKLAEQDQANASLLEEMVQMKVELATAAKALENKATEIATPLEENGLENAKELTTHIERWLQQQPDRQAWQMEEPVTQNDPKMAELPKELQDMVGELMDKEEDLTQEMESTASKWADSMDKGAGWDAADGPISNMSAQGVTGNQMPKDMEIQGRSGEGREGRSSGEMVGSTAEGKEGRRTPTRLTNDAFSNSQVDDKSQLPLGGATGGGKKGGLGGEGLEGPAPADDPNITQRLAGQQAAIRNEAERLSLQMNASGFDNFKLLESNAYLKKSEDALKQNHYQTAMYYQQEAVQSLNTAKVLAAGEVHVISDTSPTASEKTRKDVDSAMNGPMPKGYSDPVKAYFEKMAGQ